MADEILAVNNLYGQYQKWPMTFLLTDCQILTQKLSVLKQIDWVGRVITDIYVRVVNLLPNVIQSNTIQASNTD